MEANPYHPEDDIWIQFESPDGHEGPPDLYSGADLDSAREFIAENPGWKLSHWMATPREVYHANEAHHLASL